MRKILVMSDTHANRDLIRAAVLRYEKEADIIIHLGDYAGDAGYLKTLTKKKIYSIKGNCDVSSAARKEILLRAGGIKLLALHGHDQGVKHGLDGLAGYAANKGADLVLFGHTHVPCEECRGGALLYNPGSLGEPRGRKPSVGLVTVDEGKINIKTCFV